MSVLSERIFKGYRSGSIRLKLVLLLSVGYGVLGIVLYVGLSRVAKAITLPAQDRLLTASALSIGDGVSVVEGKVWVDIPYSAFSQLGSTDEERVFYAVYDAEGGLITGYEGLFAETRPFEGRDIRHLNARFNGAEVRGAVVFRPLLNRGQFKGVHIVVAQTTESIVRLNEKIITVSALVAGVFFLCAMLLTLVSVSAAFAPLGRLSAILRSRPPDDFSQIRKKTPKEILPLVNALNHFVSRLKTNTEQSEILILDAAHRIKTPLTTLTAQTELALRSARTEAMRNKLSKCLKSAKQTARVAAQILNRAMITYRSTRNFSERINVRHTLRQIIRQMDFEADRKSIEILMDIPQDAEIIGDGILLGEAFRNLIDNSLKYAFENSDLHISGKREGGNFVLSVRDRGPGINQEEREAMLSIFTRGKNSRGVIGSGMGLAIVRQIIEAHRGSVRLDQAPEGGLLVILTLPAENP